MSSPERDAARAGKPVETGTGTAIAGPVSPEARRRVALSWQEGLQEAIDQHVGPGTRVFIVLRRVALGVWDDGFIHAGNLAYMGILALFPFFITVGAVFSALGEAGERHASVDAFLTALPPVVAHALSPVAHATITARRGWLLWAGAIIGLWTVSSLIETIRDILHRAYGVPLTRAIWRYRLFSVALIVGSVVLLLLSLFAGIAIASARELIDARIPRWGWMQHGLGLSGAIPPAVLFGSIYLLLYTLTPFEYRRGRYPKWPGAVLVTLWWGLVSLALPLLLHFVFKYDLTYGSLAGVMIALFFFWLVGLGVVTGAELNAALAETPEERDMLGHADNRARDSAHKARMQEGQE